MVFFAIFRAPPPGVMHVFRQGEPMMAFVVIPEDPDIDLAPMAEDDAAQRELRSRRMSISRDRLAEGTRWLSDTQTIFDGTYRNLYRAARARGAPRASDDDDPSLNGM
jgi:hypothetical protein